MINTDSQPVPRPRDLGENFMAGSPAVQRLLQRVNDLGVPYGREDSFKMTRQRMIQDRLLIGIQASCLPSQTFFELAIELGMPTDCLALLSPHTAQANALFFGVEDRAEGSLYKVYFEFWDQVRDEVQRTGAQAPLLLHLGIKWDSARPGRHELANYTCYPLLNVRHVLRRMAAVYPQNGLPSSREAALGVVHRGLKHNPAASFLYLEVSESNNPRCSFDVNLYKTGMRVADAAPELCKAAGHFGIAAAAMEAQLQRLGHCPLGHLSGGTDRHGGEFLSVYGEIQPLASQVSASAASLPAFGRAQLI